MEAPLPPWPPLCPPDGHEPLGSPARQPCVCRGMAGALQPLQLQEEQAERQAWHEGSRPGVAPPGGGADDSEFAFRREWQAICAAGNRRKLDLSLRVLPPLGMICLPLAQTSGAGGPRGTPVGKTGASLFPALRGSGSGGRFGITNTAGSPDFSGNRTLPFSVCGKSRLGREVCPPASSSLTGVWAVRPGGTLGPPSPGVHTSGRRGPPETGAPFGWR